MGVVIAKLQKVWLRKELNMFFYMATVFLSISSGKSVKQAFWLHFLRISVSTCPSFTSSVEEGRAVCPGEEHTYNCTIFDDTSFFPTAVWSGFCADGFVINVAHKSTQDSGTCGPFTVQATASDGDCYTSTLTVTVSPELNGRVIQCSHLGVEVGRTTLLVADGELEPYSPGVCKPHPFPHSPLHCRKCQVLKLAKVVQLIKYASFVLKQFVKH